MAPHAIYPCQDVRLFDVNWDGCRIWARALDKDGQDREVQGFAARMLLRKQESQIIIFLMSVNIEPRSERISLNKGIITTPI